VTKSNNFGRSIGGSSRGIDSTSNAHNRASGGAVGGFTPAKGWGSAGKPIPEHGALNNQPARKPQPATKHNEQTMPKKPPNGGRC
jgi:hypothetical protein